MRNHDKGHLKCTDHKGKMTIKRATCYCVFSHRIGNYLNKGLLLVSLQLNCVSWIGPHSTQCWKSNYFFYILGEFRVSAARETWRCDLNILFVAICIVPWFEETSSQASKPPTHRSSQSYITYLDPFMSCNSITTINNPRLVYVYLKQSFSQRAVF